MNKMNEKVALVTGGGGGIGKAACELMALAGAKVVVTDIDFKAAESTVESILNDGGDAIALQHDVTSRTDWNSVIQNTLNSFNKLDVLVNNAGIRSRLTDFVDISMEEWREVLGVNLDGMFLGAQCAVKAMVSNGGTGSIINLASVAALVGGSNESYSTAKGGIRALTRSLAATCGSKGYSIRVNTVFPGFVPSGMFQVDDDMKSKMITKIPLGRFGQPMDIARGILFLASDDSSYITGSELVIDGGFTSI